MKTNNLIHKQEKTVNGKTIIVKIRLNDECKNGHQDFAITADIYKAGLPRTDRNYLSGGCCHEEIQKYFPEFAPFIALHLCDYKGIPMHASANGFYHLENGFNKTSSKEAAFKAEYCKYYRITPDQFEALKDSKSELMFASKIIDLGILNQWEAEAKKAIELLEKLTGNEFLVDSVRTQWAPTQEQIDNEKKLIDAGFYSEKNVQKRIKAKIEKEISEMQATAEKEISKIKEELSIKTQLFRLGGERFRWGTIWYSHTNEVAFNWSGTGDKLTVDEIELIKSKVKFPKGSKFK